MKRFWKIGLKLPQLMLALFALAVQVATADEAPADVPELAPEAVISFDYPSANPWILNDLAIFSPDGRYLIDAADRARYIQVRDWKENKVVKRLLLNENAPEMETKADMRKGVLVTPGEPGWAFSPDGRYFAVCVNIIKPPENRVITVRVWNMEQGSVAANIFTVHRNVPEIGGVDAFVHAGCQSISFSPDGTRMLMTTQSYGGHIYANREKQFEKNADGRAYGVIYDTETWQPTVALRNPDTQEDAVSPGFYDRSDGKTIFMLLRQKPYTIAITTAIKEKLWPGQKPGHIREEDRDPYVKKRLVTFDANSGQIVKSLELPDMSLVTINGLNKWSWLGESNKEVYWNMNHDSLLKITEEEYRRCDKSGVNPDFYSEVMVDCAHVWEVAVFNIGTGKMRFMVPVKKLPPQYDKWHTVLAEAWIPADGKHLLLSSSLINVSSKNNWMGVPVTKSGGKLEIYSFPELRLLGKLENPDGVSIRPVRFSNDSSFMVLRGMGTGKAAIYDLSKIPQPH